MSWTSKRTYATGQVTKADNPEDVALANPGSPAVSAQGNKSKRRQSTSSLPGDSSLSEALCKHRKAGSPSHRPNYTDWTKTGAKIPVVDLQPNEPTQPQLKSELRSLLREVAQPVAVVTSFMPTEQSQESRDASLPIHSQADGEHHRFHGATLSSFSSIAMDPYPLVAFALRVPSRMATTLSSLVPAMPHPHSSRPTQPMPSAVDDDPAHLVINILSFSQHSLAHAFSRPDLHPHPFKSASYTLSGDGLPILDNSLGALSCKVVARVKLSELCQATQIQDVLDVPHDVGQVASELFIARVTRVEAVGVNTKKVKLEEANGKRYVLEHRPLIYWRRGYTHAKRPQHHY